MEQDKLTELIRANGDVLRERNLAQFEAARKNPMPEGARAFRQTYGETLAARLRAEENKEENMDYKAFLAMVEAELDFLRPFDLAQNEDQLKAAGALVVLRDYLQNRLSEDLEEDAFEDENAWNEADVAMLFTD